MDPEQLEAFNEQMRQLNEALGNFGKSAEQAASSQQRIPGTVGGFISSITNATKSHNEYVGALGSLKKSHDMGAASALNFGKGLDASLGAVSSFAKAMNEGGGSFAKYNDSLSKAGDAALAFGAMFGPEGIIIGLVIKGFTALAGVLNKQSDALLKASDDISQMGAAGSFSTDKLQQMANQVGLTSTDLGKLTKPMQNMHGGLQTLGGSMDEAVKKFAQMNQVTPEVRKNFQRLGFDDEKRIQATADYVQLQRSSGAMLAKDQLTQRALQTSSQDYTENLIKLSAITGKSIEENKKEQEIARANVAWKIQEHKWATERQAAVDKGDDTAVKRIDMQRAAANKMMDDAQAAGGPAMAAAAATTYLTGAVTKAGAGYAAAGLDIRKMADAAKDGSYKQGQLVDAYDKGMDRFETMAGSSLALSDKLQQFTHITDKTLADSNTRQAQAMNGENRVQAAQAEADKIAANKAGKGPVAEDPRQMARNALTEVERSVKVAMDGLLAGFGALTLAAGAAALALGGLAGGGGILGKIGGLLGGGGKGGGILGKIGGLLGGGGKGGGILGKVGGLLGGGEAGALGKVGGALGKHAGWIGMAGMEALDYASGKKELTGKNLAGSGGGVAGGLAGAALGAGNPLALALDPFTFGGASVVGGLAGGALGYFGGEKLGKGLYGGVSALGKGIGGLFSGRPRTKEAAASPQAPNVDPNNPADPVSQSLKRLDAIAKGIGISNGLLSSILAAVTSRPGSMAGSSAGAGGAGGGGGGGGPPPSGGGGGISSIINKAGSALLNTASSAEKWLGTEAGSAGSAMTNLGKLGSGAASGVGKFASTVLGSMGNWIMDMIAGNEGARTRPYKDSLGLWTVGVGHLIGNGKTLPPEMNREFSKQEITEMFKKDYGVHAAAAARIPGFDKMNEKGKAGLIDLTFNMGPAWYKKWPNTVKALEAGDAEGAANGLEHSLWYKQVGKRAARTVDLIRHGGKMQAAKGGVFDGPTTGYPVELHGREMIAPLNADSVLMRLAKTPANAAESKTSHEAVTAQTTVDNSMKQVMGLHQDTMKLLSHKLDSVIHVLESTHSTQNKILRQSMI